MTESTGTVPARDGTPLYVRIRQPSGSPKGHVMVVHGLGEHSGRYGHIGECLVAAGLAVSAFDMRGFGRSGGRRAYVTRWSVLLDDVARVIDEQAVATVPLVLYGHSMGGLVALGYALWKEPRPDLLVLSAPAVDADVSPAKRAAARVLGRLTPRLRLRNEITGDQLSRDPAVGEAYFADPLVLTTTTTRFGLEFLRAMEDARAGSGALTVPTLVVHGADDTLVPTEVSAPLGRIPGVERIVLPGCRHEWHNEPEADTALATVTDWILSRL